MNHLPQSEQLNWAHAISADGDMAGLAHMRRTIIRVCSVISTELDTFREKSKGGGNIENLDPGALLGIYMDCLRTMVFSLEERRRRLLDDSYRTEGETDDIFAAILSLFIDIASLRTQVSDLPAAECAKPLRSFVNHSSKISAVMAISQDYPAHMMDAILQSQKSSKAAPVELFGPSLKLISENFPSKCGVLELARALVIVYSLELPNRQTSHVHAFIHTISTCKVPQKFGAYFGRLIGKSLPVDKKGQVKIKELLEFSFSPETCEHFIDVNFYISLR